MLSAVIIILREALEAGLIISLLLALARTFEGNLRWILGGFAVGGAGAVVVAHQLQFISDLAEGAGQELLNSILLLSIIVLLAVFNIGAMRAARPVRTSCRLWAQLFAAAATACAVTREGSEVIVYASSFTDSFATFMPILIGGSIGAGIGASFAALLYYGLVYLPKKYALIAGNIITLLIAGGMASQAVMYLTQAGLLPALAPWWDTSALLSETSVPGQLLYALVGYEATPTAIQVVAYLVTFFVILTMIWLARAGNRTATD